MSNNHKEAGFSHNVLKTLNSQDFLSLGLHDVVYVKPVVVEQRQAYAIHAADGTLLSVMGDMKAASALIMGNDLEQVVTH
jgi:hypothetical protein